MTAVSSKTFSTVQFPRTGKRGVPQQFPRRLYEMLECERKLEMSSSDHPKIISWSDSGKAFRIFDISLFATKVLSKYFRTSKFSSFQRNLNLYGFSKVRRGPDADMYAHPSFVRGHPERLFQLRKCSSAAARKQRNDHKIKRSDSVSPPPSIEHELTFSPRSALVEDFRPHSWRLNSSNVSVSSKRDMYSPSKSAISEPLDTSRLQLLAMALTSMDDSRGRGKVALK